MPRVVTTKITQRKRPSKGKAICTKCDGWGGEEIEHSHTKKVTWLECYRCKGEGQRDAKEVAAEVEAKRHKEELRKLGMLCSYCGGEKDRPRMKSDDSYSTFPCPAPFHWKK